MSEPSQESFVYEPVEPFGRSMTTPRPWNVQALAGVELLNGRVAMLGFAAALIGELISGRGPGGQVLLLLRWAVTGGL
ncbi:high light inducible protein [Synechococcus sp. RSCCF101]|uniref:chlorophyll a/b-binding protein n=1 Tax=Synechococcus sp. RSCCF101 TaxID=2511069 RepID=UPI001245A8C5|nr:chlorophyll a/b-binding protein [Synechococcus sp. RSCCF101]QEY32698.1 high light inducible protein [Synechococcus sp. RSCCF101]